MLFLRYDDDDDDVDDDNDDGTNARNQQRHECTTKTRTTQINASKIATLIPYISVGVNLVMSLAVLAQTFQHKVFVSAHKRHSRHQKLTQHNFSLFFETVSASIW